MENLVAIEGSILLWIQDCLRADWLSPFVVTYTKLGNLGFIWIMLCLGLLCFKRTGRAGAAGLLGLVFSLILNNICLKNLFARTRPYEVIDGLILMTKKAGDFSFPSGHSGSSFAAAVAIICSLKGSKWRWIVLVMAVLMAFSRLYIGIHFPTDVLCGALTGALCGAAAAWIMQKLSERFLIDKA